MPLGLCPKHPAARHVLEVDAVDGLGPDLLRHLQAAGGPQVPICATVSASGEPKGQGFWLRTLVGAGAVAII